MDIVIARASGPVPPIRVDPQCARIAALPADAATSAERVTPMMEQFLEIKAGHPGLLLFYRMGDFYELFFEDAEIASKTLGIVLTKRGRHQGIDIPMCGVPVERSEDYLHRLIEAGIALEMRAHEAVDEANRSFFHGHDLQRDRLA